MWKSNIFNFQCSPCLFLKCYLYTKLIIIFLDNVIFFDKEISWGGKAKALKNQLCEFCLYRWIFVTVVTNNALSHHRDLSLYLTLSYLFHWYLKSNLCYNYLYICYYHHHHSGDGCVWNVPLHLNLISKR